MKLADFSVAQAALSAVSAEPRGVEEDTMVTSASFFSLPWSAPEQIRGLSVDATADIYGLGLVLGFILTGERLRKHDSIADFFQPPDKLDQILSSAIERHPLIPAPVREVMMKACRARPELRYRSIEELLRELEASIEGPTAPEPERTAPTAPSTNPGGVTTKDSSPWMEATPGPPTHPSTSDPRGLTLTIEDFSQRPIVAGGRAIHVFSGEQSVDLELAVPSGKAPRIRIGFLPPLERRSRVHLKGLNCFLRRANGTPTGGLELLEDGAVEILDIDQRSLAGAKIRLGEHGEERWVVAGSDVRLVVPRALAADLATLEIEPRGELYLIHRS